MGYENDYEWFKKQIFLLTKLDLNSYKEKQMRRRIDTLIQKYRINGYEKFVEVLKTDKEIYAAFISYLTINVSEFFRNTEQWDLMQREMVPELIKKFGKNLKVWSAACSTGDEPYTIVMTLSRHIPLNYIKVLATDIDDTALLKAKAAVYEEKEIAGVPADLKKKYFTKQSTGLWALSDDIKRRVEFKKSDLLRDPYPSNYNLIVCRNVMIYFTEEAKDNIYRKFYNALAPEGILFIGATEQMMNYSQIGFKRRGSFYYEK